MASEIKEIVDFIEAHSPYLQALAQNMSTLNIKIHLQGASEDAEEVKGGGFIEVHLLDLKERREKKVAYEREKQTFLQKVISWIKDYYYYLTYTKLQEELLKEMKRQIKWEKARVNAGIEYQKTLNKLLLDYLGLKREFEERKAQISILREKILLTVSKENREKLKEMLGSHYCSRTQHQKTNSPKK